MSLKKRLCQNFQPLIQAPRGKGLTSTRCKRAKTHINLQYWANKGSTIATNPWIKVIIIRIDFPKLLFQWVSTEEKTKTTWGLNLMHQVSKTAKSKFWLATNRSNLIRQVIYSQGAHKRFKFRRQLSTKTKLFWIKMASTHQRLLTGKF